MNLTLITLMSLQIWAAHKPIGSNKWAGGLSFRDYRNADNVKIQFCRFGGTVAYIAHRKVSRKFRRAAQGILEELKLFERAYNRSFKANVNFSSVWKKALR
jgi:hypothetical protein